jgi:excisionase family DNA binding protein
METLLTLKQVQEVLQVDRTTIHRMLKDGRLAGVKVGGQWRFSRQQIESFTQGAVCNEDDDDWGEEILPIYCVQRMQDVFAEIAGIGSVVTNLQGHPLTRMSNPCAFCNLMQSSPSGKAACQNSWREMGPHAEGPTRFLKCHAGLQYARSLIEVDGKPIALIVSGQFHLDSSNAAKFDQSLPLLAEQHNLSLVELRETARKLSTLNEKYEDQIGEWLDKVAKTFSDVSSERAHLLGRLRQIAEITLDVEGGTLSNLTR